MDPVTLILTILFGIALIRCLFIGKLNKLEKLGIWHEKPWPIIGNTGSALLQQSHFTETFTKLYRMNETAKYVGYYEFSDPAIVIRTPDLIKSITVKNFDYFIDHRPLVDPEEDSLLTKNLIGLKGEKWREVRNLLSPAFTSSKMKSMFKLMSGCGQNFVDHLAEGSLVESNVLDTKEAFTRYTNDVIANCAFGLSVDSMKNPNNDFYRLAREATNFGGSRGLIFCLSRYFPKISRFFNLKFISSEVEGFFESVLKDTIGTRDRNGITRPDMIQLMMDSRGQKFGDGSELTIKEMTAQAFIFLIAGFESTATMMCFLAHEIANNADVQAKLREELKELMKKSEDGELTCEAISGMKYLDAVIDETLRLYPVAPVLDRLCVKTFELPPAIPNGKPVVIEPGQYIIIPIFPMHRDPKYFPNPDKFDPERFFGDRKKEVDPYAYVPFGLGPRMCLGNRFTLLETKVLIVHLLAKFHLQPSATMLLPLEFDKSSLTMTPTGGFKLRIESIEQQSKSEEKD